jgi:hypothetical protein
MHQWEFHMSITITAVFEGSNVVAFRMTSPVTGFRVSQFRVMSPAWERTAVVMHSAAIINVDKIIFDIVLLYIKIRKGKGKNYSLKFPT